MLFCYTETEGANGDSSKPKVEVEVIIKKPKHHRHHRQRKPRKTLRQHLYHQYSLWLKGVRLARSSRSESGHNELQGGGNSDRSDSKSSDESSQVSTCDSSCEEDASHWDSDSSSSSETDEKSTKPEGDAEVIHSHYLYCYSRSILGRSRQKNTRLEERKASVKDRSLLRLMMNAFSPLRILINPAEVSYF